MIPVRGLCYSPSTWKDSHLGGLSAKMCQRITRYFEESIDLLWKTRIIYTHETPINSICYITLLKSITPL